MKRRDFVLDGAGMKTVETVSVKCESEYIDLVERAHQGDTESMVALGDIYARGSELLEEDQNEAYICYYLAARNGHERAKSAVMGYEASVSDTRIQFLQQDAESYGCGMLALDGCFISTAVCAGLGKQDDCEELELLRHYRDTILLQQVDGPASVRQYYRLAPMIVRAIEQSSQTEQIYAEILERYLLPAIGQIRTKKYDGAYQSYRQMVEQLSERFL